MTKKLKVSIVDENTLALQEAGNKGDLIDLTTFARCRYRQSDYNERSK